MKKTLCSLENIRFGYKKNLILDRVNLTIPKKHFICIAGESGSGKSTLLYILSGLLRANTGQYMFEGREVNSFNKFDQARFRRENIGILFQDFRLLPFLNIAQNIKFPLLFLPQRIDKQKVLSVMLDLNIFHRRKAYPKDISGGEAQRTAIGRAIILKPKLLLLDEPTGNLDIDTEKKIIRILRNYQKKEDISILCVTHSKNVMKIANQTWLLKDKKLILQK